MSWGNQQQWNRNQGGFNQSLQGGQVPNQEEEWQTMQQAPPPSNTTQSNSGYFPGAQQGQIPPGSFPFQGQGQFQYHHQGQNQFSGGPGFTGSQYGPGPGQGYVQGQGGMPRQQQAMFQGYQQQHHQQQQQFSHQQMQLQQQQQKKLEMERRAREEQKQRDIEIQRRKMRNIDVLKPTAGSLEDLIALPVPKKSSSPASRVKNQSNSPLQTRSATVDVISTMSDNSPAQTLSQPAMDLGSTSIPTAVAPPEPLPTTVSQVEVVSIDKLLESSLSNLGDPSPIAGRSSKFKPANPVTTSSHNKQASNFSESTKARAWSDTTALEGMFAQHFNQPQSSNLLPEAGTFGEFQSGPTQGQGEGGILGPGMQSSGQSIDLLGQQGGQGVGSRGQRLLLRDMPHGYAVNVTKSNQRPVATTSISGLTKEGYISSDAMQSRSIASPGSNTINFTGLDASKFPDIYMEVYRRCAMQGKEYCNTELLFPILLSSQLSKSVLKDLWSMANRTVPGKVSQTELFVLLGLIGLVQSGISSPTVVDLKKSAYPPTPILSAIIITQVTSAQPAHTTNTQDEFGDFQQGQAVQAHQVTVPPPFSQQPPGEASPIPSKTPPLPDSQAISDLGKSFPVADYKPPSDDKYSCFNDLSHQLTAEPQSSSEVKALDSTSNSFSSFNKPSPSPASNTDDTFGEFSAFQSLPPKPESLSSNVQQKSSTEQFVDPLNHLTAANGGKTDYVVKVKSGHGGDNDEFGSFSSGPLQHPLSSSATSNSSFPSFASSEQGWANFSQLPPISTASASNTTAGGSAPFGKSNSGGSAILASTTTTLTASTGLDIDLTPKTTKAGKMLTALEILDEEMSSHYAQPSDSPSLSTKSLVPGIVPPSGGSAVDNFGEFEGHSIVVGDKESALDTMSGSQTSFTGFTKAGPDPCKVWGNCLDKCSEVLGSCSSVFASVEEKTILNEIAESGEGRNRLRGVIEVFRLAKRIHFAMKEKTCEKECEDTTDSIKKEWKALVEVLPGKIIEKLYEETIPVSSCEEGGTEEGDILSDTISRCSLCLTGKEVSIPAHSSLTGNQESYPLLLIFHEGQMYHPSCANFWTNVVQERLPNLNE